MKENNQKTPVCGSRRLLIAIIGFFGSFHLYSMRMNLSVGILCMTNYTAVENRTLSPVNNMSAILKNISSCQMESDKNYKDGPFEWDKDMRGFILGVFFWGYLVSQIPAGYFVNKFSIKWILFSFMMLASISVLMLPIAAKYIGVGMVAALRVICGIASGVYFPCMHQLWSRWAPPGERSLLVGTTYSGLHCGNAITLPIAGLLCEYGFSEGWDSIFYLSGLFGILWCIIWAILIDDSPEMCGTRMNESEKLYITSSLHGQVDHTKLPGFCELPWKSILTSKAFWAIVVVNVTFDWNGYTFITSTPTYMKDVLKFNMSQNGFASAMPYVGMGICQIGFAMLCDVLQRKRLLTVTHIRKLMCSIGMLFPAIIVIILAYLSCEHRHLAVALLTIGLSMTSALFVGAMVNHVDIAPQYSGLLFGLTNTMGAFTGFFSSFFVQAVTKNNTIEEWRIVFFVCAVIFVIGDLIYLLMGSGSLQPWAKQVDEIPVEFKKLVEVGGNGTNLNLQIDSNESCKQVQ